MAIFNWLDIVILIVLLRAAWVGFRRGAVGELIFSGGVLFLSFVAIKYYNPISEVLVSRLNISSNYSKVVAYFILVLLGFGLIWLITKIITFVVNVGVFKRINKIFGVVFGVIRGSIICSLLLYFLVLLDINVLTKIIMRNSFCGEFLVSIPSQIYIYIRSFFV